MPKRPLYFRLLISIGMAMSLASCISPPSVATSGVDTSGLESVIVTAQGVPKRFPIWNFRLQDDVGEPDALESPPKAKNSVDVNDVFSLVVNLSAATLADSLKSAPISENLRKILLSTKKDVINVEIVAIPDKRFFDVKPGASNVSILRVNAKRYRELERDAKFDPTLPQVELDALLIDKRFQLGTASFAFQAGSTPGIANIALSFWVNRRPVDEISLSVCIASEADPECRPPQDAKLRAYGTLGEARGSSPDASIHMMRLNSESLVGIFFCKTCGSDGKEGYLSWQSAYSEERFNSGLQTQVMPALVTAAALASRTSYVGTDRAVYRLAGDILYELVFATPIGTPRPTAAEKKFSDFIHGAKQADKRPTLFARFISFDEQSVLLPLNMMTVPVPGTDEASFVGFEVISETYIYEDFLQQGNACIEKWKAFVPGMTGELAEAREPSESWIQRLKKAGNGNRVFESPKIDGFRTWLTTPVDDTEGQFIVSLSHHYENKICIDNELCTTDATIYPSSMKRRFSAPSVVMLNGCGTAGLGASEFITRFNELGVNTFIATSTAVDGRMAGKFLSNFMGLIEENMSDPTYTVSRARYDATILLSKEVNVLRNTLYGPGALNYMLIGNGQIKVCIPQS